MSLSYLAIIGLLSCLITIVLIPLVIRLANRINAIDDPNADDRRVHQSAVPRIGGLAVILSFVLTSIVAFKGDVLEFIGLYCGLGVLLLVGVYDDTRGLRPVVKLLGQISSVILMVLMTGQTISVVTIPIFDVQWELGLLSIPFTVFIGIGLINAINLIDGLDGLASGCALIAMICFAVLAQIYGDDILLLVCLSISGAVIGFLAYNSHPAVVFLGDTGSMCLGLLLSFCVFRFLYDGLYVGELSMYTPFLALGVPIADSIWVMFSRMARGVSPFTGDRTHVHHQVLDMGVSHHYAVTIIHAVGVFLALVAIVTRNESDTVVFLLLLCLVQALIGLIRFLKRVKAYRKLRVVIKRFLPFLFRHNEGGVDTAWIFSVSRILFIAVLLILCSAMFVAHPVYIRWSIISMIAVILSISVLRDWSHHIVQFFVFLALLGLASNMADVYNSFKQWHPYRPIYITILCLLVVAAVVDMKLHKKFKLLMTVPLETIIIFTLLIFLFLPDDLINRFRFNHTALLSLALYLALKDTYIHGESPRKTALVSVLIVLAISVSFGILSHGSDIFLNIF